MRILVDNSGYELLNLGDVAMLQVAVSRFRAIWPEAQITVITTAPDRLKQYCPGAVPLLPEGREIWLRKCDLFGSLHQLVPQASKGLYALEARIRRRVPSVMRLVAEEQLRMRGCDTRPMKEFLDALFSADLVVGTGGGYLTDSFAEHAIDVLETLHIAQRLGTCTALIGQGLGPVSQSRVWNPMQRVLPRVNLITLREGLAGKNLAMRLGVEPARLHVTGDDALPLAMTKTEMLGNGLGVNVRTAWYAAVPPEALGSLHRAVRTLGAKHRAPLVPIPVSAHAGGEDSRAIAEIVGGGASAHDQQLQTPRQLVERIGACRLVITGSYHAGVFALAQGIPIIGLVGSRYYADKFAGLTHQFRNVGSITVVLDQPDVEAKLVAAGDRLIREGPHVRETLIGYAKEQVRAGERAYELLAQVAGERRASNGSARRGHSDGHRSSSRAAPERAGSGL